MANLLSLESSAESCSVALSVNGVTHQKVHQQPRQHAQSLLPMVDELLQGAQLSIDDIDAIAFSRGPGSFTGIRICMSVVQGLAYGCGAPVIPVSTLQALAAATVRCAGLSDGDTVLAAFDARMGEAYFGQYRISNGDCELVAQEQVLPVAELVAQTRSSTGIRSGSGWALPAVADTLGQAPEHAGLSITAQDIDVIAQRAFNFGKVVPVELAEPVYLRNEVTWKKRETIRRKQFT